jgi:hypothetical protein
MPVVSLPAGTPGQPYFQCISLTGTPRKLGAVSLPPKFKAELNGRQLCISTDSFPKANVDWAVQVLACRTCEPLELTGTISAAAEDCPCEPMEPLDFPATVTVGIMEQVNLTIDLTGTGPFEFCDSHRLPKCLKAEIVGDKVLITGKVEEPGIIAFSVKNPCTCECQEVIIEVVARAAAVH